MPDDSGRWSPDTNLLSLFSQHEFDHLQNFITQREHKNKFTSFVKCAVREREIQLKPEEAIRQLWLHRLIKAYKYPVSQILVEYPVTFGRDTSKRADIVILDIDRPTVPYVIIECKTGAQNTGKEQLKSYCNASGAPLAMWTNGEKKEVWNRKDPNIFMPIHKLPERGQSIEDIVNEPWTIDTLIEKDKEREERAKQKGVKSDSLQAIIVDMEDEVLANAGVDVFEEVFKLIFTKLFDEMECHQKKQENLKFRNNSTASKLKENIQDLFDQAKKKWPGVFLKDDTIRLSVDHLQVCIGTLEGRKLFNSNLDIIDDAFEYLVSKSAKGEKGQYFTPRWVIDMCVKMLNPQENETLIDTACGSAGFTVHAMFHVWEKIMRNLNLPISHLFTAEEKHPRCRDYVQNKVFAIDFDERSVRVARCLNLIAGDGETNVLHLNSLDWQKWEETADQDEWQNAYGEGWIKFKRQRASKKDFRHFKFDVLLANPPFAGNIKQSSLLALYELSHKQTRNMKRKLMLVVGRDILFIERNLDMLKPGGRMAVVLPQGRFNNATDQRVREYIMKHCRILAVIGLHPNTFKPHTGTKTSVLFVQKWNEKEDDGPLCPKKDNYRIFFATQQIESVDNSGQKVYVKNQDDYRLRDDHGHEIVHHDLFNHDGKTNDGIFEEFKKFAIEEDFSFFQGKH